MKLDDFEWGEGWLRKVRSGVRWWRGGFIRIKRSRTTGSEYLAVYGARAVVVRLELSEIQARLLAALTPEEAYELLRARTSAPSG